MIRRITFSQLIIAISLAPLVPLLAFAAWTGPTAVPPTGNSAAPINVGTIDQFKQGTLGAKSLNVFGGSQYLSFGNSIGSAVPGFRLNSTTSQLEFSNGGGAWSPLSGSLSPWTINSGNIYFTGGNVGAGTTTPRVKLDVAGGTEAIYSRSSADGSYTFLGNTGTYGRIGAYNISTGWQNLILAEGGNVGVGTTNPSSKMHVEGLNANLRIQNSGFNTGQSSISFGHGGSVNEKTGIVALSNGTWGKSDLYFVLDSENDSGPYDLAVDSKMIIKNSGNVGIGTTNPGQKLTVSGTIESTSGGIKFPDGTTQTTAAAGGGITAVTTTSCSSGGFAACTTTCPAGYFRTGCSVGSANGQNGAQCYPTSTASCSTPLQWGGTCFAICAK